MVETIPYDVVRRIGDVEIRSYSMLMPIPMRYNAPWTPNSCAGTR